MILVLIIALNAICANLVFQAYERDEQESFRFDMGDLLISRSEMNRRAGKLFKEARRWNRKNSSNWR